MNTIPKAETMSEYESDHEVDPTTVTDFEFIIFDLETTGLNVEKEYIVELSALITTSGERFHSYIMPPGRGEIGGTEFHGLTRDILREKGAKDTTTVLKQFLSWVYCKSSTGKSLCFVAHNNFGYDQLILENEYARNGLEMINCFYADSYPFFKGMGTFKNVKLGTVYETIFGKKFENAHTAEADVEALFACLEKYPEWKQYIPMRIATYRVDDTNLEWFRCMLKDVEVTTLGSYGYTNLSEMLKGVDKYGDTYLRLLVQVLGNWVGKRIYGQLRHVIRHKMKREPHGYSTRSKSKSSIV